MTVVAIQTTLQVPLTMTGSQFLMFDYVIIFGMRSITRAA